MKSTQVFVSAVVALHFSCGGQEQSSIDTFFAAVKSKDAAARSAFSSVDFSQEVESWNVVELGTESTEPFRLPELRRKARDAKRDLDLHNEKGGYFIRDNRRLYDEHEALIAKNPDHPFKGELAKFHEEWQDFLLKQKDLEAKMEEANAEIQKERSIAAISLIGGTVTDDFEGEVSLRQALVNVKDPQGGETPYQVTLRKYNLVNKATNAEPRSRWIITDIQEQGS